MRYDFLDIAWTLRTEMVFYIALGLALCLACAMRNTSRFAWTLGRTSLIVALATAPLYILALRGRAPETFLFAPYFWFGGALYFAIAKRSSAAVWVLATASGAILWEFLARPVTQSSGLERAVGAQVALLVVLLGSIAVLAVCRLTSFRAIDRTLGDITYALYLSHAFVMVAILSLTTGYSLTGYLVGVILSIPVAVCFHIAVEPSVNRIRNMVRSGRRRQGTPLQGA
jgi:peptidoglycan/LPS O-acetylase OafA/YrhL